MNALPLRDAINTLKHQGAVDIAQREAFALLVKNHLVRKTRHGYQAVAPAAMADTFYTREHRTVITTETGERIPKYTTSVYVYHTALDWLARYIRAHQHEVKAA